MNTFYLHPSDVGLPKAQAAALRGGDAAENARIIGRVLDGEPGPARDIVLFNAGAALFIAFATTAYGNGYFRLKMAALTLAGANAVVFHFLARWSGERPVSPAAMRVAGSISIVLWTAVILAGRMMSYTMF